MRARFFGGSFRPPHGALLAVPLVALFVALLAASGCAEKERKLTIFYTTDAHGHIISDATTIGLDKIAAVKKSEPHSLLLDAGDFLHGNLLANIDRGEGVIRMMKEAGYFAAAAGNHEFSHGLQALLRARELAAAPPDSMRLLSANVRLPDGSLLLEPHAGTTVNGVRVCVFGLTTPETATQASPDAVAGLLFEEPETAARRELEMLRQRGAVDVDGQGEIAAPGCDLVVALTHLGSAGHKGYNSVDLALGLPGPNESGLDLLIDGHSHVIMDGQADNGVWVVSSGEHGKRLGRLDIVLDTEAGKVVSLQNRLLSPEDLAEVKPDAELAGKLAALRGAALSLASEVVADSPVKLTGKKSALRTRETGLGDLCADAARYALFLKSKGVTTAAEKDSSVTGKASAAQEIPTPAAKPAPGFRGGLPGKDPGVQVAIINAGNIRAPLKKGPVSRGDILNMLPFGGKVVVVEVTGRELLEILEHGFSALPDADGRFPQVSGLRVRVNPNNPPGRRVLAVELPVSPCLDFEALNLEKRYTLAVNEFMAAGGDGYPHLAGKPRLFESVPLHEALVNFMLNHNLSVYKDERPLRIIFSE